MVGLCGGDQATCPWGLKIKARLKTQYPSNKLRGSLSDINCPDLVTQRKPVLQSPHPVHIFLDDFASSCCSNLRAYGPQGLYSLYLEIRCPEMVRAQPKVTQHSCHRATPRIQGANCSIGFSPCYNKRGYF